MWKLLTKVQYFCNPTIIHSTICLKKISPFLPLCNDGGLMQNWCERQRELATEGRKTLKRHTDLHLRLDYEKKSPQLSYILVITLLLAESLSFNFAIYWNCHYKSKMQECSKNYDAFSSSKRIVLIRVT